jgi:hypothetical protein
MPSLSFSTTGATKMTKPVNTYRDFAIEFDLIKERILEYKGSNSTKEIFTQASLILDSAHRLLLQYSPTSIDRTMLDELVAEITAFNHYLNNTLYRGPSNPRVKDVSKEELDNRYQDAINHLALALPFNLMALTDIYSLIDERIADIYKASTGEDTRYMSEKIEGTYRIVSRMKHYANKIITLVTQYKGAAGDNKQLADQLEKYLIVAKDATKYEEKVDMVLKVFKIL